MKVGDRVKIIDWSEVHGEIGFIYSLPSSDDGFILVELQGGDLWPVSGYEIRPYGEE